MARDKNPESKDRNHYLGHSYVFLLAARLGVEMANAQLDFINRGISGNNGEIKLLPTVPSRWSDISAKGLRARGDYMVDIVRAGQVADTYRKRLLMENFKLSTQETPWCAEIALTCLDKHEIFLSCEKYKLLLRRISTPGKLAALPKCHALSNDRRTLFAVIKPASNPKTNPTKPQ